MCCSSWGCKESDMTATELKWVFVAFSSCGEREGSSLVAVPRLLIVKKTSCCRAQALECRLSSCDAHGIGIFLNQ